jgi:basic membrane protein A and related proteins
VTDGRRLSGIAILASALLLVIVGNVADDRSSTGQRSTTTPSAGQPSARPSFSSAPEPVPRVAIAYDAGGRSAGYNALALEGAKRFADAFDAEFTEITAKPDDTEADLEEGLTTLAEAGNGVVFLIGSTYAGPLAKVAPKYPDTWFGIVDDGSVNAENVVGILFNEEQGAYLVGAAAALTSKTGNVGFIGTVPSPLLQKYEAGFTAGARAADPDVKVQVAYLLKAGDAGVSDPGKARKAALGMYDADADVIFAAAGPSSDAVIQAAHDRGRWAIGADADRYLSADPSVRGSILTSMVKRVDVGTYTIGMEMANGVAKDGNNVFGVGRDGVGYSISGGFLDPIKVQLDRFAARIAAGEILVPRKP